MPLDTSRLGRRGFLVGATGAAAMTLAACGNNSSGTTADGKVEITFASYSLSGKGAVAKGTQKLIDDFMAKNPNIVVKGRAIPNAEILTKTRTDIASGDSPQVVQMGYSKVMEALTTLPVASIEKVAGAEWTDAVKGLTPGPLNTGIHEGSNHAVPFTLSTPTMFYNATLLSKVGVNPDKAPQNIEELRAATQKLVAAGHQGAFFGVVGEDKSDFTIQSVLNSTGGGFLDAQGNVSVDSPESQKGFEVLQKLVSDGLMPALQTQEAQAPFISGDMGFFISTTAYSTALAKGAKDAGWQLRSAAFPQLVADHAPAPTHSGAALMMLKGTEAQQQAAWQFIKYLTSREAYLTIVQQMGYLPLYADMVDKELADYFAKDPLLMPAIEQLDTVAAYQFFPGKTSNQSTRMFIDEAVEPIVLRNANIAETTAKIATKLKAAG
ncbi:extracellular solute-binding protein [Propionibacteriaceae bacterium G1746]|uniref:extracellular solute-binding protein n=1 Tax=Aestuariimicrobium sp. G57 TaxID=3418485 RepID=UPI003C23E8CF